MYLYVLLLYTDDCHKDRLRQDKNNQQEKCLDYNNLSAE